MKLWLSLLLAVVLVCSTAGKRAKRQAITFGVEPRPNESDCVDSNRRQGKCRRLTDCGFWLGIVSNNPSRADILSLRGSICPRSIFGAVTTPLVCCPFDGSSSGISPRPTQRPTQFPTQRPRPTFTTQRPFPTFGTQRPNPFLPTARPTFTTQRTTQRPSTSPENHRNRRLLPQDDSCGTTIVDRIVGGDVADLGQYPWLAVFGYRVRGTGQIEFNCGGTLINDRYVLTAAHCVTRLPSDFQLSLIRLGEYDMRTEVDCQVKEGIRTCGERHQDFSPEQVIPHADYNRPLQFWNDIALVRLDRNVNKNAYVSPICLPFGEYAQKDYTGERLWVAGFGLTEAFGEASDVLMDVRVPVIDNQRCAAIFRPKKASIGDMQMCAGAQRDRDSCSGDSGGPLMGLSKFGPPYRAVGIVSFGVTECGTADVPGVYTRVSSYLNWIMDNLRQS